MKTDRSIDPAASPKRTHIERNQEAERRFLDAAMRLVAEKGASRMTLADVGEASGYSSGLVSHYFGNKAGLLLALVGHVQNIVLARMQGSSKHPEGLEVLLQMASNYLRPNRELQLLQRALYALRIEAMLPMDPRIADRMASYYRECETFVERQLRIGIERGEIQEGINPPAYALVFLSMLQGIIAQSLVNPEGFNLPLAREATLSSLRHALAPASRNRTKRKRATRP